MKHRAQAFTALHADVAAHQFDQAARNRQAQPRAPVAPAGHQVMHLGVRRKQSTQVVGRHADTGVANFETKLIVTAAKADGQGDAADRRELDRIGQQVAQHLGHAKRVAHHHLGQIRMGLGFQCQAFLIRPGVEQRELLGHQTAERKRVWLQLQLASLALGQIEQVVEHLGQLLPSAGEHRHMPLLCGIEPACGQQLGRAQQGVERRAQLMAHLGQKVAFGARQGLGLDARLLQTKAFALREAARPPPQAAAHHAQGGQRPGQVAQLA